MEYHQYIVNSFLISDFCLDIISMINTMTIYRGFKIMDFTSFPIITNIVFVIFI